MTASLFASPLMLKKERLVQLNSTNQFADKAAGMTTLSTPICLF